MKSLKISSIAKLILEFGWDLILGKIKVSVRSSIPGTSILSFYSIAYADFFQLLVVVFISHTNHVLMG